MTYKYDYLIIGSGVAGMSFALKVADTGKVALVCKSSLDEANTDLAQGGVASVTNLEVDNFEKHIHDTMVAGDWLSDPKAVEQVITQAPEQIKALINWGVDFDKNEKGDFDLHREGGHSEFRILHHADNTGHEIQESLIEAVKAHKNIDIFDNTGVRTLRTHGKKIDIDNNVVEERSYSSTTDEWYTTKTLSSVITITINGKQLISCGDTCIFYDKRLTPEHEFYLDDIEGGPSGMMDAALISGVVNNIKNKFGKPMVVVIKSQMGAPIYAFSGNKVYWEVQDDLPRFTKLMIDGMALYIHRANFQIIDKALLD